MPVHQAATIRPLPTHLTIPDDKDHHLTQTPGQETNNVTSAGQRPSSSRTSTYKGIPLTIANVNKFLELCSFSAKKCGQTRAYILFYLFHLILRLVTYITGIRTTTGYKQMLDVIYELEKVCQSQMFNRCSFQFADRWQP